MIFVKLTDKEIDITVEFLRSMNLAEYFKSNPPALARFKKRTSYDDPDKFFNELIEQIIVQKSQQGNREEIALTHGQWLLTFITMAYIERTLNEVSECPENAQLKEKILPTIKSICHRLAEGLDKKQTMQ